MATAMSAASRAMRIHARRTSASCLLRSGRPDPNPALLQGQAPRCRWFRGAAAGADPPSTPANLGLNTVPQLKAFVVERFGHFLKTLPTGVHFLVPGVDRIAYVHSLKDTVIHIPDNPALTKDNTFIQIGGVIHLKITDPFLASYAVENPIYAVTQLAQTAPRTEIAKITLEQSFEERAQLNSNILKSINDAACEWGVKCLKYDFCITPPVGVQKAMALQAEAQFKKRARIIESEVARMETVNEAKRDAEASLAISQATARGIATVSESLETEGSTEAARLRVTEEYLEVFSELAKKTDTILLPSNRGNGGAMIPRTQTADLPDPDALSREMPSTSDVGGVMSDDKKHPVPHPKEN